MENAAAILRRKYMLTEVKVVAKPLMRQTLKYYFNKVGLNNHSDIKSRYWSHCN
jgi:hypothetical protein